MLDMLGGSQTSALKGSSHCSWAGNSSRIFSIKVQSLVHWANLETDPGTAMVLGRHLKSCWPGSAFFKEQFRKGTWAGGFLWYMEEHAVDILKKQNQMGEQVVKLFESCSKGLCQCETPIYGGFFSAASFLLLIQSWKWEEDLQKCLCF